MAPAATGGDPRDLAVGAVLQVVEAVTLGMPFEVWKTRNGAYTQETAMQSLRALYKDNGIKAFWRGSGAKVAEAGSKGAVLVYAKEAIIDMCVSSGMEKKSFATGSIAGAGGGVCQTVVMSPLTYVVTYKMKHPTENGKGMVQILREAGLGRAYGSALPMALRQGSNWALRQGINDLFVGRATTAAGRPLTTPEKVVLGLVAGCCACINQPFEVLRIKVQSEQAMGKAGVTTMSAARGVMAESGAMGFFAGIIPRFGLAAWQTLFMVTFVTMAKEQMAASDAAAKKRA